MSELDWQLRIVWEILKWGLLVFYVSVALLVLAWAVQGLINLWEWWGGRR